MPQRRWLCSFSGSYFLGTHLLPHWQEVSEPLPRQETDAVPILAFGANTYIGDTRGKIAILLEARDSSR